MKKSFLRPVFLVGILSIYSLLFTGCKKDIENLINCLGETTAFRFNHTVSQTNPKEVELDITYSGGFNFQNTVRWNFGDGNSATTNSPNTTHVFANAGTYTVTASVRITEGDEFCEYDLTESVTVN